MTTNCAPINFLGRYAGDRQPRMAWMNTDSTDEQAYARACARDLYTRCIHLAHSGHTIYDKYKKQNHSTPKANKNQLFTSTDETKKAEHCIFAPLFPTFLIKTINN
jgi:hypothetical protein